MSGNENRRYLYNKSNILISNLHPTLRAPLTHRHIKSAVKRVFKGEHAKLDALCLSCVDRKIIKKINIEFLKHNYFTDIITFPYSARKDAINGELFMCLDVIKENAEKYDVSYMNEFERVLIHGCLHLTGYNDKTKAQKELIRQKENFYLS